jgi:hypothetical protein
VNRFGHSVVPFVAVAMVAASSGVALAAGSTAGRLPDPCRLLTKAHPETSFGEGRPLAVSHRQSLREFTGVPTAACTELVGTHRVELTLSTARRGVESVDKVRSRRPLSGLGAGETLTIYTRDGAVARAITFDRAVPPDLAPTYASISLIGGGHLVALKTLARRLYKEL